MPREQGRPAKDYAFYKGDTFIAVGTMAEIAAETGMGWAWFLLLCITGIGGILYIIWYLLKKKRNCPICGGKTISKAKWKRIERKQQDPEEEDYELVFSDTSDEIESRLQEDMESEEEE